MARQIELQDGSKYTVPTENKVVTIRARFGKTQGKLRLVPAESLQSGQLLTGQPLMTEIDKTKFPKVITAESFVVLEDGKRFNLNNEFEAIDYAWAILTNDLAENFDKMRESERALFYVEDLDKVIDVKLSTKEKIHKAEAHIYGLSSVKRKELCKLIGVKSAEYWTDSKILEHLLDFCSKTERGMIGAEKILRFKDDKSYDHKLFLVNLEEKKIVNWQKGILMFNDISLGITIEHAVEWIKDPINAPYVEAMKANLGMETTSKKK